MSSASTYYCTAADAYSAVLKALSTPPQRYLANQSKHPDMTKKQTYTAPQAEVFVLQSEGLICTSNRAILFGLLEADAFGAGADNPYNNYDGDF